MNDLIALLVRAELLDGGGGPCPDGARPHVDGRSCVTAEARSALTEAKALAVALGVEDVVDGLDIDSLDYSEGLTDARLLVATEWSRVDA